MAILVDFYGPLLPQFVRQLKLICAPVSEDSFASLSRLAPSRWIQRVNIQKEAQICRSLKQHMPHILTPCGAVQCRSSDAWHLAPCSTRLRPSSTCRSDIRVLGSWCSASMQLVQFWFAVFLRVCHVFDHEFATSGNLLHACMSPPAATSVPCLLLDTVGRANEFSLSPFHWQWYHRISSETSILNETDSKSTALEEGCLQWKPSRPEWLKAAGDSCSS